MIIPRIAVFSSTLSYSSCRASFNVASFQSVSVIPPLSLVVVNALPLCVFRTAEEEEDSQREGERAP